MSARGEHCPFLNRTDSRCGGSFRLDGLQHAFEFCFDRYTACPTYHELLLQRQSRRAKVQIELNHDACQHFVELRLPSRRGASLPTRCAAVPDVPGC